MTSPDDLRREASRWHGRNELLRMQLLNAAEALEHANLTRDETQQDEGRVSRGGDTRPDQQAIRAEGRRWATS